MYGLSQTTNYAPLLRAEAELELRRRKALPDSEWTRSSHDPAYFLGTHAMIFNATNERWEPFRLWPAQRDVLRAMLDNRMMVVLKARQLGLTWLTLGYILWRMIFRPAATVGIFSRIETDAGELLDNRLKGMYERLPSWARPGEPTVSSKSRWTLPNGSTALAFATTGGRGYTFSHVMVDEADFQPDLPALLNAIEPTVDAGGQMLVISTVDKSKPQSRFKAIYRAAVTGDNAWHPVFLPWHCRPERDAAWYAAQEADTLANTGALDDLHQEYPATATEALAPRTLDKRIPAHWIEACYVEMQPVAARRAPSVPGLVVYVEPQEDRLYVIGADPAEGNPTSDDSALSVMDVLSGEEVALLAGKFQPSELADYVGVIGDWYNRAGVMVERNNHGHAVLLALGERSQLRLLNGYDDRSGWLSNRLGKTLLYNEAANAFRDRTVLLHSFASYTQLASIEGSTLRAPEGENDDRADSFALATVGRAAMMQRGNASVSQSRVAGRGGQPMVRRSTRKVSK